MKILWFFLKTILTVYIETNEAPMSKLNGIKKSIFDDFYPLAFDK